MLFSLCAHGSRTRTHTKRLYYNVAPSVHDTSRAPHMHTYSAPFACTMGSALCYAMDRAPMQTQCPFANWQSERTHRHADSSATNLIFSFSLALFFSPFFMSSSNTPSVALWTSARALAHEFVSIGNVLEAVNDLNNIEFIFALFAHVL